MSPFGVAAPSTQLGVIKHYLKSLNALPDRGLNQTAEDRADQRMVTKIMLGMIRRNGYVVEYKPGKGFVARYDPENNGSVGSTFPRPQTSFEKGDLARTAAGMRVLFLSENLYITADGLAVQFTDQSANLTLTGSTDLAYSLSDSKQAQEDFRAGFFSAHFLMGLTALERSYLEVKTYIEGQYEQKSRLRGEQAIARKQMYINGLESAIEQIKPFLIEEANGLPPVL